MNETAAIEITSEQKRQFAEDGFFVLENAIPPEHLDLLRSECQGFIDRSNAEMDKAGVDVQGLCHRNKRYFVGYCFRKRPALGAFVFGDVMADICRQILGPDGYLFFDQYVVKCAEVGLRFSWHQDSGYVGFAHKPYLSCWCALDDVNEENGTVYMLPYARAGTRERIEHVLDKSTNDLVGYHGKDPGVPVIAPAGSIAVFSSVCFHSSGANHTQRPRRIYLSQYSSAPIINPDTGKPLHQAVPFLKNGERVVG